MAVSFPQNWAADIEEFDMKELDCELLMSLLEESQVVEECDDERLLSVMKSLQAEIDCNHNDGMEGCYDQLIGGAGIWMDGQDCSTMSSSECFDFEWIENMEILDMNMDIDMDMVPRTCSPCSDMTNWYIDSCGDEIIEYGSVRDFSVIYSGLTMGLEEQACGSLWQEY